MTGKYRKLIVRSTRVRQEFASKLVLNLMSRPIALISTYVKKTTGLERGEWPIQRLECQ